MVWVGRNLKDHLVPTPLPWTGTSSTRPGCSEPHPTWPVRRCSYLCPPELCSIWSTVHRDCSNLLCKHSKEDTQGWSWGLNILPPCKKSKIHHWGWELEYSRKANTLRRKQRHFGNNPESSCGLQKQNAFNKWWHSGGSRGYGKDQRV